MPVLLDSGLTDAVANGLRLKAERDQQDRLAQQFQQQLALDQQREQRQFNAQQFQERMALDEFAQQKAEFDKRSQFEADKLALDQREFEARLAQDNTQQTQVENTNAAIYGEMGRSPADPSMLNANPQATLALYREYIDQQKRRMGVESLMRTHGWNQQRAEDYVNQREAGLVNQLPDISGETRQRPMKSQIDNDPVILNIDAEIASIGDMPGLAGEERIKSLREMRLNRIRQITGQPAPPPVTTVQPALPPVTTVEQRLLEPAKSLRLPQGFDMNSLGGAPQGAAQPGAANREQMIEARLTQLMSQGVSIEKAKATVRREFPDAR